VNVSVTAPLLVAFVLATVRAAAWLTVAPPFGGGRVPVAVKGILAFALALPVAPRLPVDPAGISTGELISDAVLQVFVGGALGFVTYLLFAGIQAAGSLIDLFGGFQIASAYDPLSQSQNSVFGKLTDQLAAVLLFALNGHLLIVEGFERSYTAIPLGAGLELTRLSHVLTVGIVDVGLGLLTKMAPALNALSLSFPAKILATLLLFGLVIPLFPGAVERVTSDGLDAVAALYRHAG